MLVKISKCLSCQDHQLAWPKLARETNLIPKAVCKIILIKAGIIKVDKNPKLLIIATIIIIIYLHPTFVGLSSFGFSIFLSAQVKAATTEALHLLNSAEELPEENVRTDLPPSLDCDILHREVIRANFEQFELEALVYGPDFAVACSNLTLEQGKYTGQ